MKLLGQTTFCIGLQVLHLKDGSIFLSQATYINGILKRFNMIDAHLLSTPMIGRSSKGDDVIVFARRRRKYWENNIHISLRLKHYYIWLHQQDQTFPLRLVF